MSSVIFLHAHKVFFKRATKKQILQPHLFDKTCPTVLRTTFISCFEIGAINFKYDGLYIKQLGVGHYQEIKTMLERFGKSATELQRCLVDLLSQTEGSLHLQEVVKGFLQHIVKPYLEGIFIALIRSSYRCDSKRLIPKKSFAWKSCRE